MTNKDMIISDNFVRNDFDTIVVISNNLTFLKVRMQERDLIRVILYTFALGAKNYFHFTFQVTPCFEGFLSC